MEISRFIKSFNHFAIEVKDLNRSIVFYREVLRFNMLPRPDFDFAGAWFDIGLGQQIHLIENKQLKVILTGSRSLHFAFEVTNLEAVRNYLLEKRVEIAKDIKELPDGVLQMFVQDPDGYYLEFTEL